MIRLKNMKNLETVWILLLGLILKLNVVFSSDCLKNLRVENSSNRSITLAWDYDCQTQVNSILYKIYFEHVEWKACKTGHQDETRGAGRGNLEVEDVTQAIVENLHPYSLYKLSVKALPDYKITPKGFQVPEELEKLAETLQGVPNVRPSPSRISTKKESTSLKFYWSQPLESQCEHINAQLDGYFYILKGIEEWNVQEEIRASENGHSHQFEHLKPYSNYILFVYAKTMEGLYNPDLPFKIPAETMSSIKAGVPRDLKVVISQNNGLHHMTWLPPYPPTGLVSHYIVRWKLVESSVWSDSARIEPTGDLCSGQQTINYTRNEFEKRICYTWTATTSKNDGKNVTFQVAAYNAGSSTSSDWSASVYPIPEGQTGQNIGFLVIIIVASVVAVLFIVLIATFASYKCLKKKRQQRYKNVPVYIPGTSAGSVLNSFQSQQQQHQPGGTSTLTGTSRSSMLPPPWTPPSPTRRQVVGNNGSKSMLLGTNTNTNSKYQHLLLPIPRSADLHRPVSIQEVPLPALPDKEPLYEELSQDTLLRNQNNQNINNSLHLEHEPNPVVRVSFNKVNETDFDDDDEEGEFLKPTSTDQQQDSDDGYLTPKSLKKRSNSLDDEYLKPTFNQFTRINSRDLSPPHEEPPPIPMQSYGQVQQHPSPT